MIQATHAPASENKAGWFLLMTICLVQLGTTGDTSILANEMSALIGAFHTSIASIQLANIMYPLITGAFMMLGGTLGFRFGWKRMLFLGNVILVIGEIFAYFSWNIVAFTFIARILVGIGASLAIPATIGIVMAVYKGQMKAIAFSGLAAANGLASAVGPIIGGWIITALNWRDNYILLAIVFLLASIATLFLWKVKVPGRKFSIDFLGALLAVIGLALFTFGMAKITSWGAFQPINSPFTIFDLSPAPFFVIVGILFIWFFSLYESKREARQQAVILPQTFIHTPASKSGLYMNAWVFMILGGVMFSLVTFLQMVLDFSPVKTGVYLLYFAIGIIIFSIGTPIAAKNTSPRTICRWGIVIATISCFLMAFGLERAGVNNWFLIIGLFVSGAGVGLLSSQASNVVSGSVPESLSEVSAGVQGTTRNVGNAFGIAVVGLALIMSLTTSVKGSIAQSNYVPQTIKQRVTLMKDVPLMSNPALEKLLEQNRVSAPMTQHYVNINLRSRVVAIRITFLVLAILILLGLFATKGLPGKDSEELA